MLCNLSVCSEESEDFDQEIGLWRSHHWSGLHQGVWFLAAGRRSGSLQVMGQGQIGDTAASGFLPKCGGDGQALNHKQDETSVSLWVVLERVVLRAEQGGAS